MTVVVDWKRIREALKPGAVLALAWLMTAGLFPSREAGAQGYWSWPTPPPHYYGQDPRHEETQQGLTRRPVPRNRDNGSREGTPRRAEPTPRRQSRLTPPTTTRTESPRQDADVESANPFHRSQGAGTVRAETSPAATPAAQPPVAPAPARLEDSDYVSLVWGNSDSLSATAKAAGVSTEELLRLNDITYAELREGQVLRVPKSPTILSGEGLPKAFDADQQRAREIWRGVRGKKRVALTFDAGGEDDGAVDLVSHLKSEGAPATFFVTGDFVEKNPDLIREIAAAGFPIHNHSWTHPEFTQISEDAMYDELARTDEKVLEVVGKPTKPYWRPPFGDRDRRVLRATADAGYQSIYWTIDTLDSVGETKGPEFVIERVLNFPRSNGDPERFLDGAIVLMHVGKPETAAAIPQLVRELRQRGFTLVTVDEILRP